MDKNVKECEHNWFDDNLKGYTYCENCGMTYNEYRHKEDTNEMDRKIQDKN